MAIGYSAHLHNETTREPKWHSISCKKAVRWALTT